MSTKCHLLALPRELRDLIYEFLVEAGAEHRIKTLDNYANIVCPFVSSTCLVATCKVLRDEFGEIFRKHVLYDTDGSIITKITDLDATHLHGFLRSLCEAERKSIRADRRLLIEFRFTSLRNIHVNRLGAWGAKVEPLASVYVHLRGESSFNHNYHAGQWYGVHEKSRIVFRVYRDWFQGLEESGTRDWYVNEEWR